ncbi:MAG: CvpA family protein [Candidatus Calescibacterium sp.]|nr:CvpA family protein [Candidatus Calescibacterium sp.]MDW8195527.1 CvpA family protein [Candidatus Calescibacterium sp.]
MIDIIFTLSLIFLFRIGYERGLIAEITDLIALLISIVIAFALTEPLGSLINSMVKIKDQSLINFITGITIFFLTFISILAIGYSLEIYSKRNEILEKSAKLLGGITGLIKGIVFWWKIFLMITIFPTQGYFKDFIKSSYSYTFVSSLNPLMLSLMKYVFPANINKKIEKELK